MSYSGLLGVTMARDAVKEAIIRATRPYQQELTEILGRADHVNDQYTFQTSEDADSFLALRRRATHEGAEAMREALLLLEQQGHTVLAQGEDSPKDAASPTGYNKVLLLEDNEQGFFAYAFVVAPKQETPPHTHSGLCASFTWKGGAMETNFIPAAGGTFYPDKVQGRIQGEIGVAIGPTQLIDLHKIHNPSPSDTLVLVHLYDGWNITRIDEKIVTTQFETRNQRNGVDEVYTDIAGEYPVRPDKSNPGEGNIMRMEDAVWVERLRLQNADTQGINR